MRLLIPILSSLTLMGAPVARATPDEQPVPRVTPALEVVQTYQGHTAEWWAQRSRNWHARAMSLHRTLLHDPTVAEAINLACAVYGHCTELWRKARCETVGTFSPTAANRDSSARGLFQFLTSPHGGTWASTPFGRFSVFDPFANALAAGWMHVQGRGGEWVCR